MTGAGLLGVPLALLGLLIYLAIAFPPTMYLVVIALLSVALPGAWRVKRHLHRPTR
jgi:hypothetical protein